MKRSGLTLGLALLATGFLLGCEGSNLTTPDVPAPEFGHKASHNPGGGGGDGGGSSDNVFATADGAVETVDPRVHEMEVFKDNGSILHLGTFHQGNDPGSRGTVRRNFAATWAAGIEACFALRDPEGPENVPWGTLFALLNDSVGDDGRIGMQYDKAADGVASGDHGAGSAANHDGIGGVLIGITGHVDPSVVGTKTTDAAGNAVYSFGGGTVRIWLKKGPTNSKKDPGQKLFCPNAGDQLVVTVSPDRSTL